MINRRQWLQGAALGFIYPPLDIEAGTVRISGHVPLLEGQQWSDFIDRYLYDLDAAPPGSELTANAGVTDSDGAGILERLQQVGIVAP